MAEYRNELQYGRQDFEWDPATRTFSGGIQENSPAYLTELLGYRDRERAGQAMPWEAEQYQRWEQEARAIPTRDIATLQAGWQGDLQGTWDEGGWREGNQEWWNWLDPGSPDSGPVMLAIRDKMDKGEASDQERQLYEQTLNMANDWNYRASVPQESDANPFGMGDQFMMALSALTSAVGGAGAFGAFGAGAAGGLGAGAAAGAGAASSSPSLLGIPLSTLSTIGTGAGYGSQLTGMIGGATDQDWLQQISRGLGVTSGLAGGLAGIGGVINSGVTSLTDAARLASSAGRLTGAVGQATDYAPLQQAASYLGRIGQVGGLAGRLLPESFTDWSGGNAPTLAGIAPQAATPTPIPRTMSDQDWLRWSGRAGPWNENAAPGTTLLNR